MSNESEYLIKLQRENHAKLIKEVDKNHTKTIGRLMKDASDLLSTYLSFENIEEIINTIKNRSYDIGFIYVLESALGHKIGRSRTLKRPEKLCEVLLPIKTKMIYSQLVPNYVQVERSLHSMFEDVKIKGEWFRLTKKDLIDLECEVDIYLEEDPLFSKALEAEILKAEGLYSIEIPDILPDPPEHESLCQTIFENNKRRLL